MQDDDARLRSHVRPSWWRNPHPAEIYDLVVIGGGTAGLVSAVGAAALGARVAMVEKALLGGDCLNTGCVPSKTLLRSARAVAEARRAAAVGVRSTAAPDPAAVLARLRARRADIAPHDSAERLAALGVDVFFGAGAFSGPRSIRVGAATLRFKRAVVATGSRPVVPPISGLESVPFLTTDSFFFLDALPRSLAVIGAGPAGCELAQALALLGTQVTVIDAAPRVLPRDDPEASTILARRLEADGVRLRLGETVSTVSPADGGVAVALEKGTVKVEALLLAAGRIPNVEQLGLEAAGVAYDASGIHVDDRLRSTNPRVFAAGDVCSRFRFTHAADALARIAVQNALFFGRRRASALVIPWCTYTFPEVAHVGVDQATAAQRGLARLTVPLETVHRSVVDEETDGFLRIYHRGERIHGATIVAPHAGDLIGLVAHLMQHGGGLGDLAQTVFPYPTTAAALKQAADAHRRLKLTPRVRKVLAYYFSRLLR